MGFRIDIGNIDLRNIRSAFNWEAYWASRYPSGLVLTVNSDTQITLDWTNNGDTDYDGVSIERSTDGVTYAEIDTAVTGSVQYIDAGLTENYYWYRIRYYRGTYYSAYSNVAYNEAPLVVYDGNTAAWYKYDDLTTVTKDGANRVSVWADRLGSGHNLLQGGGANQPTWSMADGVLFDGATDYMQTLPFVYNQPQFIYFVGRQVTWSNLDYIFDGINDDFMSLSQKIGIPNLIANAGAVLNNVNLAVNTFGIIRLLYNGAVSTFQINETASVNGNLGAANAGGFTLSRRGVSIGRYSNIEVKEIILRNVADGAGVQAQIYNYLKDANGL